MRALTLGDAQGAFGLAEEEAEIYPTDDPLQEWSDEVTWWIAGFDHTSLRHIMM